MNVPANDAYKAWVEVLASMRPNQRRVTNAKEMETLMTSICTLSQYLTEQKEKEHGTTV